MEILAADTRDLEDAYQEAQRTQVAWAEALPSERSLIMRRAAEIMDGMALRKGKIVEAAGVQRSGGAGEKEEVLSIRRDI